MHLLFHLIHSILLKIANLTYLKTRGSCKWLLWLKRIGRRCGNILPLTALILTRTFSIYLTSFRQRYRVDPVLGTPLIIALREGGNFDVVKYLVETAKVDVNFVSPNKSMRIM